MAGGLHHHHETGGSIHPATRRTLLAEDAPACEQAAGTPPLSRPAACSPFPFAGAPCRSCAGTPARRCCWTLAALIVPAAEGSKFQDLTAPIGEAA